MLLSLYWLEEECGKLIGDEQLLDKDSWLLMMLASS
jgi:hypothetical protein